MTDTRCIYKDLYIYFEARVVHGGCARGGVVVAGGGGGGGDSLVYEFSYICRHASKKTAYNFYHSTTAQVRTTIEPIIIIVGQLPST